MPAVLVAVPKPVGKRIHKSIGVFVQDKGIIQVDIPPHLRFGDEFEITYDEGPNFLRVLRVPLPQGIEPGLSFRHRAPNGKIVLVACPPGTFEDCVLLVPWSDSTNEHYLVQAQVAPTQEQSKPQTNKTGTSQHRSKPNPSQGFSVDDIRLAQALSLTMLTGSQTTEEAEMSRAIKASMQDYTKLPIAGNLVPHGGQNQIQIERQTAGTDSDIELAIKASLAEAQSRAAVFKEMTFKADKSHQSTVQKDQSQTNRANSTTIKKPEEATHANHSPDTTRSKYEETEEEILRKVTEASLKEYQASKNKPRSYRADHDDDMIRKVTEISRRKAEQRAKAVAATGNVPGQQKASDNVMLEPYAFTKQKTKKNPEPNNKAQLDDGFTLVGRRGRGSWRN